MKILNVVSIYFSIPFFFGDQLTYFSEKGYDVHVACSPSSQIAPYAKEKRFSFFEVPMPRKLSVFADIRAVYRLFVYIRREKFNVVCGHTAKGSLIAMIAAFLAQTEKRVYFRHGFYYENLTGLKRILMLNLDRFTALLSTKIVCVSPFVLENSVRYKLNRRNKMVLLNRGSCNGVDATQKFNPTNIEPDILSNIQRSLGINEQDFVIGFTGRLVRDKGIVELTESFKNLCANYKNIKLLIIGPVEERDKVPESTLNYLKESSNVILTGLIENNIEYYYELMDVLVLPTLREGLGTSILEASSMAKPVLASDHTGSKDAMIDGLTGSYIKPTVKSISENISAYLEDSEMLMTHGEQGRVFILNNFSQELIWAEIEEKLYLSK